MAEVDSRVRETTAKLLEINAIVEKLDPAVRAAAFERLAPLYFDGAIDPTHRKSPAALASTSPPPKPPASDDRESFYAQHDHVEPSDNVLLIAAWYYSQHGAIPLEKSMVKQEASDVGLTIPARPDMTMRAAVHKKKPLFKKAAKGYALTVHGEAHLKSRYGVRKGNRPVGGVDR